MPLDTEFQHEGKAMCVVAITVTSWHFCKHRHILKN